MRTEQVDMRTLGRLGVRCVLDTAYPTAQGRGDQVSRITKAPPCIVLDFETQAIEPRPNYPPKPVSLALKWPDRRDYLLMAWGHGDGSKAAGNNCTEKEARGELAKAHASRYPILCQNGMFDHDVAETVWGLTLLPCPGSVVTTLCSWRRWITRTPRHLG
jgi:hypothetical protein